MTKPILRRIDKDDFDGIQDAVDDGFKFIGDSLTYRRDTPRLLEIGIGYAKPSDKKQITDIALAEIRHSRLFADPQVLDEVARQSYVERIEKAFGTKTIFVAVTGEHPIDHIVVGFAILNETEIELIAVKSDCQGCGIGRKLVDTCVDECLGEAITVRTQARNYQACRFYEHLGFKRVKIERDYHKHEDTSDRP